MRCTQGGAVDSDASGDGAADESFCSAPPASAVSPRKAAELLVVVLGLEAPLSLTESTARDAAGDEDAALPGRTPLPEPEAALVAPDCLADARL